MTLTPSTRVLEVTFDLVLLTDTTLGTPNEESGADIVLATDPRDGRPVLRGTTMSGALRHYLRRHLGLAPADPDGNRLAGLLGHQEAQRRLHTATATCAPVQASPAVRTRIRLDPGRQTVAPGALFTAQVLPAGTVFPCRWQIHLPGTDKDLLDVLALTLTAAEGLHPAGGGQARIRLGHAKGRGRGQLTTRNWKCEHFELTSPAGFEAYFGRRPGTQSDLAQAAPTGTPGHSSLGAALDSVLLSLGLPAGPPPLPLPSGERTILIQGNMVLAERLGRNTPLSYPGLLQHGSGAADPGSTRHNRHTPLRRPVHTNPTTKMAPIEPGTAIHSALRRQARYILSALGVSGGRREEFVENLFGSSEPRPGRNQAARPSRVSENEPAITGSIPLSLPRVRLNPLTQGAMDKALMVDDVLAGGQAAWEIRMLDPTDEESGLLWLILRDFEDGHGPGLGAGTAVGHGRRILEITHIHRGANHQTRGAGQSWREDEPTANEVSAFLAWATGTETEPTALEASAGAPAVSATGNGDTP